MQSDESQEIRVYKGEKTIIRINERWCKGCELCMAFCPKHVYEMEWFKPKPRNIAECTGCLTCELLCPDLAIQVERLKKPSAPAKEKEKPSNLVEQEKKS